MKDLAIAFVVALVCLGLIILAPILWGLMLILLTFACLFFGAWIVIQILRDEKNDRQD